MADTIDISKPSLIGFKKYGVPHVLSIAVKILYFFAIETTLPISWNSNVLLPGFSTKISFVFLVILFSKVLRSCVL